MKPIINIFLWAGLLHLVSEVSGAWAQSDVASPEVEAEFKTVEWVDLIPPEVLEILLNPPAISLRLKMARLRIRLPAR